MKRFILAPLAVALFACAAGLSGCTTTGGAQPIPPAQIAAVACPQLNLVHTQLVALNTALEASTSTAAFGKKADAQLAAIQPIINGVCNGAAAAPAVNFANLQTLVQTGFPALSTLVASLPMSATQEAAIQAAIAVAETAAGMVNALQQAQPAPATSSK